MAINLYVIELYHTLPQLYNLVYFQTVSVRTPTYENIVKFNATKFSNELVHIGRKERYIFFRILADARKRNYHCLRSFAIFLAMQSIANHLIVMQGHFRIISVTHYLPLHITVIN